MLVPCRWEGRGDGEAAVGVVQAASPRRPTARLGGRTSHLSGACLECQEGTEAG